MKTLACGLSINHGKKNQGKSIIIKTLFPTAAYMLPYINAKFTSETFQAIISLIIHSGYISNRFGS